MKILFLTDNFPPEVNAPASRTFEHCRVWVEAGHQVTVITCAPNFPTGRVFDGYRNRLRQVEVMDGIRVIRVWSYITANEGFLRRILDYLSFMVSATFAGLFVPRPDVIVGTSPQFFTACAACLLGWLRRRPYVFELRDLWPESIKVVGAMRDSVALRWLEKLELFLYRRAAGVVSVTHSFKDVLTRRGIDPDKIAVITNGVDLARFSPRPKDVELEHQLGLGGRFVLGYVGTHGLAHGLETLLEAADRIRSRPGGDRYRFLFLGDGASKRALKAQAVALELGNVLFLDSVGKKDVARYWSLLDASIIHLRKSELFETVIPSKLFECMAMGLPVLHGVGGESARIVEGEGVGLVFESGSSVKLVQALETLAAAPELRARMSRAGEAAARRYDRTALARDMLAFLLQRAGLYVP